MDKSDASPGRFRITHTRVPAVPAGHPAVAEIRRHLLNRDPTFQVTICAGDPLFVSDHPSDAALSYLRSVYTIRQPFVHDDFDYLRQVVRRVQCSVRWSPLCMEASYAVQYLTTREQEQMIGEKLQELIAVSDAARKTDFEKIWFVYNYILDHVEYDYTLANHSAYYALFEGKAVCEGCAALLYRFLSSVNIPCRIITGQGLRERHAWNIVKLEGSWYYLDVTWDIYSGRRFRIWTPPQWFLKGERFFTSHVREAIYDNEAFNAKYPVALADYPVQRSSGFKSKS